MYKTILVHVDATKQSAARVETAARLAMANEAHLVGTALTGLASFMFPVSAMDAGMPAIVFPVEELRAGAENALDSFDAVARALGVASVERRCLDEEVGVGLCLQARYADLVVISQIPAGDAAPYVQPDFPQYTVVNCARPVLVLPANHDASAPVGKRVTVAWNGSPEAVHAISSALGVLRGADRVNLLVMLGNQVDDVHGDQPGADMALYLARHGVKVEVNLVHTSGDDDGQALLTFADEQDSDLIVMGAFGHSRFREFVLGGVTRTAMRVSHIPLWMAH